MLTSFSPQAFHPLATIFRDVLKEYGIDVSETDWQRLKSKDECQRLLEQAGYSGIAVETEQMDYHLHDVNDWWELVTNTAFCGLVDQLPPAQRAKFQLQHQDSIRKLATDKSIWLDIETIFSSASK
jgi:hypothetical protein